MSVNSDLGATLRAFRATAGLTQRQLSELSTLSIRAIRDLENGRSCQPHRETIALIAEAMSLGPSERMSLEAAAGLRSPGLVRNRDVLAPRTQDSLIGREWEVRALESLLAQGRSPISVVGLAGVGKSRLVREVVAGRAGQRAGEVAWLSAGQPFGFENELASHTPETPADDGNALATLEARLRPGSIIVVDGYERASGRLVEALRQMLNRLSHVQVVITTRVPHGLVDSGVLLLGPLAVPAGGSVALADVAASDSIRLLTREIQQMQPGFEFGAESASQLTTLCRLLDGVPGALQMCGWWSLVHGLDELVRILRIEPHRLLASHPAGSASSGNLLEAITETVRALSDRERRLLDALCACQSACTIDEAARLLGGSPVDLAVHGLLVRGLVRAVNDGRSPARYAPGNLVRLQWRPDERMMNGRPAHQPMAPMA